MRIPSVNRLIPSPQRALNGMAYQAAGVVVDAATKKYVPNAWARWGIYVVSASMGMWYPLTRAVLNATNLDTQIESI